MKSRFHPRAKTWIENPASRKLPEYGIWRAMHRRCYNSNTRDFKNYGAKGITVCERWNVFEVFLSDMGRRPAGMTIERINNSLGYHPENCRWATFKEQQSNRSDNRRLIHKGESLTLAEWARRVGLKRTTLRNRLKLGWSVEKSLTVPTMPYGSWVKKA